MHCSEVWRELGVAEIMQTHVNRQPSLAKTAVLATAQDHSALDTAFALIEGAPGTRPVILELNPETQLGLERRSGQPNGLPGEVRGLGASPARIHWHGRLCRSKPVGTRYELIPKIRPVEDVENIGKNRDYNTFFGSEVFLSPKVRLEIRHATQ